MTLHEVLLSIENPVVEPATMVDPPSGWKHGFPALLRENYPLQLLVAGYKEEELDTCVRHTRAWSHKE